MKRIGLWVTALAAVIAVTAMGQQVVDSFTVYLGNAKGEPFSGPVPEGTTVYVVVKGTGRYCGMDQFPADILIFDFKTGAYIIVQDDPTTPDFEGAWFRELGGPGSGLFFWVTGRNSNTKVGVQLGSRLTFGGLGQTLTGYLASYLPLDAVEYLAYTHWTGLVLGAPTGYDPGVIPWLPIWNEGDYEYLDSNIGWGGTSGAAWLPQERVVERTSLLPRLNGLTLGRLENKDTIIVVVRDLSDPEGKAIDQGQLKILDTEATLTVAPPTIDYGCPGCPNIEIVVQDPDENLNSSEIDYVPVFVILNPGSWNPTQTEPVNNFCSLLRWGGWFRIPADFIPAWDVDQDEVPDNYDEEWRFNNVSIGEWQIGAPIRWYNIYANRWIDYSEALTPGWFNAEWVNDLGGYQIRAVIFVPEEDPASGRFKINLGNLEDFQQFLWNTPAARNYKLPRGTTISFYYIDPNDFDDMDLGVIRVGYPATGPNAPYSQIHFTDPLGHLPITGNVKLGWDGLYIRVYDKDADVEWCCCDQVIVHVCDPHNEDDSEYLILDETGNSTGVFFTQAAVPLMPVWDAVAGYQLVFDDWRIQAFNEDTIFAQYNSVDYVQTQLNALGDSDPNDGFFPPHIDYGADRNQYWDISFAKVRVFDTQVFDGRTHKMWFADCAGNKLPGPTIPYGGQVGLVVEDPDQNEEPRLRELISGNWDLTYDTAPFWFLDTTTQTPSGVFVDFFGLAPNSVGGLGPAPKIFVLNARNGRWEILRLVEVRPDSGVFRSTVCVDLAGEGTLGARPGDTIMAFYQDPSNHSDISIISMKVALGGAPGVVPPAAPTVRFDRASYAPGDRVVITVTDPKYKDYDRLEGTDIVVVKAADNVPFMRWNSLVAVDPATGTFQVEGNIPADFTKFGTITAEYTDPFDATRKATATARVERVRLTDVTDVEVVPNPVTGNTVSFKIKAQPAGAVADEISVVVYDLTGREIWTNKVNNADTLTWTGGVLTTLRSTAYIYIVTVKWDTNQKVFKGFLYVKR
ncbi:MAG: T9SS type A sorting domain-containing protein [Candidatus Bipolaricaulaceae bacterium]